MLGIDRRDPDRALKVARRARVEVALEFVRVAAHRQADHVDLGARTRTRGRSVVGVAVGARGVGDEDAEVGALGGSGAELGEVEGTIGHVRSAWGCDSTAGRKDCLLARTDVIAGLGS